MSKYENVLKMIYSDDVSIISLGISCFLNDKTIKINKNINTCELYDLKKCYNRILNLYSTSVKGGPDEFIYNNTSYKINPFKIVQNIQKLEKLIKNAKI